jgi:class 3 adenylate cyclase
MESLTKQRFDTYLDVRKENIESTIHDLWISKDESLWSLEPYYYIKLGETADKLGQSMFAHDILREGFEHFSQHLRMAQLYSLSLIKCGFIEKAREILTCLVKNDHTDEETLGILGRVYKDMWLMSDGVNPKSRLILRSRKLYLHAFKKSNGYYSGINAASLSRVIGDEELSKKLASMVLKICSQLLKEPERRSYWVLASLGEAFLLLGNETEAERFYSFARKYSTKNYSELSSTRKQLKLLQNYLPVGRHILDSVAIPAIVAFSGHMIDYPGSKRLRFPPGIAPMIKDMIAQKLDQLNAGIGYSSVACGSDILFLECMQKRNAETNVILPFHQEDFFKTSIAHGGPDWIQRAEQVLKVSSRIVRATEGRYGGDDFLFSYTNRIIMGKALLRGKLLESTPVLLAVWDKKKNGVRGGTSEFVRLWAAKKLPLEIIDVNKINQCSQATAARPESPPERLPESSTFPKFREVSRVFKAMLFADLVGYSKLKEEQLPYFLKFFLWELAKNLKRSRFKPVFRNSWGDCMYFVFNDLISAAECALELRDFIRERNWQKHHLPQSMNIRIGLHAGPVYYAREPILNRMNYFGSHVTTAARIEPITSPGNVYASEQFASLLMTEHKNSNLECSYVGIVMLPKEFGKYPIYLIKRKMEIA